MANPETASFPGAVMTDNDIPPWSDRIVATLVGDMDNSQTTFTLSTTTVDGNSLNTPCVLTIGNERIRVLGMTGAAVTSCTRAFGGSSAATHASGDAVRCNLTAYTINQALAHIKAIETTLGANLANLPGRSAFKTSGNFTVPAGVTQLRVTLIGGGGGGAGATTNLGGGGGGAGEVRQIVWTVIAGEAITCAYGAGGTGGAINTAGGDGGTTSVTGASSGAWNALGGKGGSNSGAGGDSGSEATGGTVGGARPGEIGWSGAGGGGRNAANQAAVAGGGMASRQTAGASANVYRGGGGGGCPFGNYAGQVATAGSGGASSTMNATAGDGYGSGGAGGCYDGGTVSVGTGSAGRAGAILFQWN